VEVVDHVTPLLHLSEVRAVVLLVELERVLEDAEQDEEVPRLPLGLPLAGLTVVTAVRLVPFGLEALAHLVVVGEGDIMVELVAANLEAEDRATAQVRF
jgi:hypothetical protein